MSKIKRLPDAELEIMNALWDADAPLTAAELETALPEMCIRDRFILFRLRPAWLLTAFNAVLSALALFDPFQDIVGGMFSIPAIVYYLSVIGLFLFLTGQALERRRWN